MSSRCYSASKTYCPTILALYLVLPPHSLVETAEQLLFWLPQHWRAFCFLCAVACVYYEKCASFNAVMMSKTLILSVGVVYDKTSVGNEKGKFLWQRNHSLYSWSCFKFTKRAQWWTICLSFRAPASKKYPDSMSHLYGPIIAPPLESAKEDRISFPNNVVFLQVLLLKLLSLTFLRGSVIKVLCSV